MAALFPSRALMGSIFKHPSPPHSSFWLLHHHKPTTQPPRKLPQAWQQRGAIRVTLSPVSIPINQRWNWIPAGIIKGPAPVLMITSNKALQVIGLTLGTLAGNEKIKKNQCTHYLEENPIRMCLSNTELTWSPEHLHHVRVPHWRHKIFGDILSVGQPKRPIWKISKN